MEITPAVGEIEGFGRLTLTNRSDEHSWSARRQLSRMSRTPLPPERRAPPGHPNPTASSAPRCNPAPTCRRRLAWIDAPMFVKPLVAGVLGRPVMGHSGEGRLLLGHGPQWCAVTGRHVDLRTTAVGVRQISGQSRRRVLVQRSSAWKVSRATYRLRQRMISGFDFPSSRRRCM